DNCGRERIAENIRLETFLLGIPNHDDSAVEFADRALRMEVIEDGVATWPEFTLVNAGVNTAVRGHGGFRIVLGVLPFADVESGELLHFGKRKLRLCFLRSGGVAEDHKGENCDDEQKHRDENQFVTVGHGSLRQCSDKFSR